VLFGIRFAVLRCARPVRRMSRAAAAAMLLLATPTAAACAEVIWFAGAGLEAPRPGQGQLGDYNRAGPTLVAGGERALRGATGVTMRIAVTRFPADDAARGRHDLVENHSASLGTLVGGVRFRRRELAWSPYFDVGVGLGFVSTHHVFQSSYPASGERSSMSWVTSWGAGIGWRGRGHDGVFADGHWDTVPGGPSQHAWVASLRAGMEWR
jgi:hypothetical protein